MTRRASALLLFRMSKKMNPVYNLNAFTREYSVMENNIFDFTKHLQQLKAASEKPIPLEGYALPNTSILMDPALQLDLLVMEAAGNFINGDLEANKIHRLLTLLKYIYEGFMPKFELKSNIVTRQLPGEKSLTSYSVYAWAMMMERMRTEDPEATAPFRPSYQLELQLMEFDDDFVIDKGTIYPQEWMEFTFSDDEVITKRIPRHFIKKMNNLVRINGGQGVLTDDGYLVVLPYGGKLGVMIALVLEHPITLLPEDQRPEAK